MTGKKESSVVGLQSSVKQKRTTGLPTTDDRQLTTALETLAEQLLKHLGVFAQDRQETFHQLGD
jgi:hypothetical protein